MGMADTRIVAAALLACFLAGPAESRRDELAGRSWRETKCERYRQAWAEVRRRFGIRDLGPAFIERHDAFIASGCTADADVCPRSDREIEIANILTIAAMNAGTASTFLPFSCKPETARPQGPRP
jgi:hypothetical protein